MFKSVIEWHLTASLILFITSLYLGVSYHLTREELQGVLLLVSGGLSLYAAYIAFFFWFIDNVVSLTYDEED